MTNRQRLLDLNSSLEFKLHRLYFISLLNGGVENQLEALHYARHFQPFAAQHQRGETRSGKDHTAKNNISAPENIQTVVSYIIFLIINSQ